MSRIVTASCKLRSPAGLVRIAAEYPKIARGIECRWESGCRGQRGDYRTPHRLALALYAAFSDADGIAYRARHNNGEICYALFDRVSIVGLVPAKEMPATLNARAESVARKPMFRNACKQRRRIIPPTASQWWKVR
jgi:hypothetical protein